MKLNSWSQIDGLKKKKKAEETLKKLDVLYLVV